MSDKNSLYNTVFSLIEEELYQRLNSSGYSDNKYDGSKSSICGSSNLDISSLENERIARMQSNMQNTMPGRDPILNMMGGGNLQSNKKYVPGKFDAVKHSYKLPLNVALQGTLERQRLFLEEQQNKKF